MSVMRKQLEIHRFQVAVVILLIVSLVWVLMGYFRLLKAEAEQRVVTLNIQSIERLFSAQIILHQHQFNKLEPWYQQQPRYLHSVGLNYTLIDDVNTLAEGHWGYHVKTHAIIYHVASKEFFKSSDGRAFIVLKAVKQKGLRLKKNHFKWCANKHFYGCRWRNMPKTFT